MTIRKEKLETIITYFFKFNNFYVFGRLGLLFAIAAFILVFLTYYIIHWALGDKDNILDVHDAYYHYQFVQSWGDPLDTNHIKKELNNLKLFGAIFYLDADTLCQQEDYVIDFQKEKELTYWSNINESFSFCDYLSYQDSDYLAETHNVNFPEMVSFSELSKVSFSNLLMGTATNVDLCTGKEAVSSCLFR